MKDFVNMSWQNYSNCSAPPCDNSTDKDIYNSLSGVAIFLTVYTLILTFAVAGNSIVCWIVISNRRMHEVTNYLLVNLAVSDLIQALATVFQVTDFVVKDLNLGKCVLFDLVVEPYQSDRCNRVLIISAISKDWFTFSSLIAEYFLSLGWLITYISAITFSQVMWVANFKSIWWTSLTVAPFSR